MSDIVKKLGLNKNPVLTGLWQVADLERGGTELDREPAAQVLCDYINDGFTVFDMADHYGSAELIAGRAKNIATETSSVNSSDIRLFTKWCPQPHQTAFNDVKAAIETRLQRLNVETIDLLQFHWWSFQYPGYIDVMDHLARLQQDGLIQHLGLTNFDTDHLRVLLSCGHNIVSNQVCISVLDPRALQRMSEVCLENDVRLLAYGTLAGGFLSDRWLNRSEPDVIDDWSKMKYKRFIDSVGGWHRYQELLQTLAGVAETHGVSIANVASKWVLQQPAVAGVIVGARITERQHRDSNRALNELELSENELNDIAEMVDSLDRIPGDCGTEYRRPPFLTAAGDLTDHLEQLPPVYKVQAVPERSDRWIVLTGSEYEPMCGYSRAMRIGDVIKVSGTTATHGLQRPIGENDAEVQAVYILDKLEASIKALGGSLEDVVRTRIYLANEADCDAVSKVHGRYFGHVKPANTLFEISRLIGPYTVEIEAEAILPADSPPPVTSDES